MSGLFVCLMKTKTRIKLACDDGTGPTVASAIATRYADYPVIKKQKLFQEVMDQLAEIGRLEHKAKEQKQVIFLGFVCVVCLMGFHKH